MTATKKFFRRGKTKIFMLPAVANPAAPTRPEITAGLDLSRDVATVNGFGFTSTKIPTPNLADSFTATIPGEDTAGDSSLVLYSDDGAETVRAGLVKGTTGFILIMVRGDGTGKRVEVWPVESSGPSEDITVGNDPARYNVPFAVTDPPHTEAVLPAP